ncbi:MAG: hypothetical protein A3H68_03160 [Candidatus Taylorbacteria bacterium RIFCSPLOWO2_02_FULL_46_40]|uniref:Cytidyltransferase n=1 Tax=Candidatus Taylorbacteria bacterium RIFCSPLOWO2_02_FULL_46_40 TaxID=1802329 RepID=A0A1G2P183_9BACT|nr:MAG: hypothetical protein A3H68_03160 [Candidatus Taylorbacteria bacterium RIFCSPLOWO2_02_FULL_46_40]
MKKLTCVGIIPARGGSKSIPKKNIAMLCGKPLICYTIESAKKSKLLDSFIVSTDDPETADVAKSFGADVPFLRPKEFSTDTATDLGFLKHALIWLRENRNLTPDVIVNLRPTGPFRGPEDIDAVLATMQKTGCDSVRTLSKPNQNPFKMWYVDESNFKMTPLLPTKYFDSVGIDVPRQLLPQNVYWTNALVDATKTKFILEQDKIYGPDIRAIIVSGNKTIDIDGPEELAYAEYIMRKK